MIYMYDMIYGMIYDMIYDYMKKYNIIQMCILI